MHPISETQCLFEVAFWYYLQLSALLCTRCHGACQIGTVSMCYEILGYSSQVHVYDSMCAQTFQLNIFLCVHQRIMLVVSHNLQNLLYKCASVPADQITYKHTDYYSFHTSVQALGRQRLFTTHFRTVMGSPNTYTQLAWVLD